MRALEALTLLGFAATFVMVVVIWVVQLHVYPLFQYVSKEAWPRYHAEHLRRFGWIAAPPMLLELAGALGGLALVWLDPLARERALWYGALAVITLATWGLTFLVSVPLHRQLQGGWEEGVAKRLVHSNWLRTAAWSAKGVILLGGVL